jgi:hypothetical protein
VAAPGLLGPSNRTTTTISVRINRSPEPDRVCKPDIGYEVMGGTFADWQDVGGFATACDTAAPGYRFNGLTPNTTYTFSVRAYRLADGVKVAYSSVATLTATTLEDTTSTSTVTASEPTPTPTPEPTPEPSPTPEPAPAPEPTPSPEPAEVTSPTVESSPEPSDEPSGEPPAPEQEPPAESTP